MAEAALALANSPIPARLSFGTGRPSLQSRSQRLVRAVARLDPDVTIQAAEAEATATHRRGRARESEDYDAEVVLAPIIAARGPNPAGETQVVWWLSGVSLAVLLIACSNVANLLLARSIRARQQIAVRLALGASRGQLIGEQLAESLVFARRPGGSETARTC